jgi:hypothetical protein
MFSSLFQSLNDFVTKLNNLVIKILDEHFDCGDEENQKNKLNII